MGAQSILEDSLNLLSSEASATSSVTTSVTL